MKKATKKKLVLAKETVKILEGASLVEALGGGEAIDPITYWPEQCTGAGC